MCERLADLAQAFKAYSSSFDAALLLGSEASRVVTLAASIKNIAASLEARAATRAEDCGAWARSGDRSPAHHLARVTGSTVGEAIQAMDPARKLAALPETKQAAEAGRLSARQAQANAPPDAA